MVVRRSKRGNIMDVVSCKMFSVYCIIQTLLLVCKAVSGAESHNQAFVQTENELRDMGEVFHSHVIPGQNLKDMSLHEGTDSTHIIQFEPPLLDFGEQSVGMPSMRQVTVNNPNMENSLHLLSISGSTLHFHCSFFQDKMVPPGGNTSFDVVFLARQVGNVENTLYIHTSQGSFRYQVFGIGVPNPYRIRPFIGAKVPINSSFSPLIHMHNPHSSVLQVVEMYSSGGDLHLELPTGEQEANRNLWEIPPYETKPVMRASILGRTANNHTAFIRIKTNRERKDQVLILPVEVEVSSNPGIFSQLEMLDFGMLRSQDGPRSLQLNLINSGSVPAHITGITVSPPNDAVSVDFRPIKLQPNSLKPTTVAQITFTASKAVNSKKWTGNIVIHSKNDDLELTLPYQAQIVTGSLEYSPEKAKFYVGKHPLVNFTREFPITNKFNTSIAVYNYNLSPEAKKYFTIENFDKPVIIPKHQTVSPLSIKFHPDIGKLQFKTELILHTNLSVFNIPLKIFDGKLKVVHHRPEIYHGQLDFGTMGMEEKRSMTFTLRNENPVDIVIREFGANMDKTLVDLLGVEEGNGTMLTRKHNTSLIQTNPLILKPYHFAVFMVELVAPKMEGTFAAEVIIVTQFENLYIPITLRTAEGSLTSIPEKVLFDKAFPGKILKQELKLHSSFIYYMEVKDVTFQPNDSRFSYERPKHRPILLEPLLESIIGHIKFNPRGACQDDCYIGLPTYIPVGQQWLLGMTLNKQVVDIDQYLYSRFKQKWEYLGSQQQSTVNVTLQLDTNKLRGFLFPAQAHLHWPTLARTRKIVFPLTQIGNLSITEFYLENPADVPVLMQIVPLSLYPNPQSLLDLLSPELSQDLTEYVALDPEDEVFTLQDLEIYHKSPKNPVPALRRSVESLFGVKPHPHSITMLVGGGTKLRVRLGFNPKDDALHSTVIILRNNLTIIDTLVVRGQGGRGDITFGGQKPGSTTPLTFFLGVKHLKNCDKKKQTGKSNSPNFTIKKTFVLRNTGELPLYVQGFTISDSPCEGYGFKVLECASFELPPNTTKKLDIAFTPDFSMSRIQRTLAVHTTLGPSMNFTLQATVPSHMLSKCSSSLPRPTWEPILYYTVVCMMSFLLFSIIVASYFEADRILTADILRRRARTLSNQQAPFDKGKVFDLRTIAGVKNLPENKETRVNSVKPPTPPVSNSYIEQRSPPPASYRKKKSRGPGYVLVTLVRYLVAFFSRSKNTESPPPPYSYHQTVKEKDVKNNSFKNDVLLEKSNSASNSPVLIENSHSIPPLSELTSTKNKSGKRSGNSESANGSIPTEHKEKETHVETLSKNNTDSGKQPKNNSVNTRKNEESVETNHMNVSELDDIVLNVPVLKEPRRGRKKLNKIEEVPNHVIKRNFDLDQDDTSSTTTDSSAGDGEDKSGVRDVTPEPLVIKSRKTKVKSKKKRRNNNDEVEDDRDDFIISSKSKAHKKIKIDSNTTLGGNIHRPSSIELPYTTKLEAEEAKAEPVSPHALATDIANSAIKKTLKNTKGKGRNTTGTHHTPNMLHVAGLQTGDTDSDRSKESPPPIWDHPKPVHPANGDLSELSLPSEQFAQKLGKPINNSAMTDGMNSRSNSYSSIVSSGSANSENEANRMKKMNAHPNPLLADNKPLGAIGTKPENLRHLWNMGPVVPGVTDDFSGGYGLQAIHENQPPRNAMMEEDILSLGHDELAAGLSEGIGPVGLYKFGQPRLAIMQELQAERRRRLMEYQQKQQEEWPGFGSQVPHSQESLWDAAAAPKGSWSTITHSPPRPKMTNRMWDNPVSIATTNQPTGNWNLESIWSSSPTRSDAGSANMSANSSIEVAPEQLSPRQAQQPPIPNNNQFDPLNTLSIWQPSTSSQSPAEAAWKQPSSSPQSPTEAAWKFHFKPGDEE